MNKGELIERVAKDARITKVEAGRAIDSVFNNIRKTLKRGEKTSLVGFGTFSVSRRKARTGRNPQSGEAIKIPARKVVRFTSGKALKETIR
jgi:DNA-binding protein HU-beta